MVLDNNPSQPEYLAWLAAAPVNETEAITETNKTEHDITLSTKTTTESGAHLAEGTFDLRRTDTVLTSKSYFTRGGKRWWQSITTVHVAILLYSP